jgi:hypothetical protein
MSAATIALIAFYAGIIFGAVLGAGFVYGIYLDREERKALLEKCRHDRHEADGRN